MITTKQKMSHWKNRSVLGPRYLRYFELFKSFTVWNFMFYNINGTLNGAINNPEGLIRLHTVMSAKLRKKGEKSNRSLRKRSDQDSQSKRKQHNRSRFRTNILLLSALTQWVDPPGWVWPANIMVICISGQSLCIKKSSPRLKALLML